MPVLCVALSIAQGGRGAALRLSGARGFHGEERERQALGVCWRLGACRGPADVHSQPRRLPADGGGRVRRARRRVPRDLPAQERGCGGQVPGSRSAQ